MYLNKKAQTDLMVFQKHPSYIFPASFIQSNNELNKPVILIDIQQTTELLTEIMSYEFYIMLHFLSLITLFLSMGMLITGPVSFKKFVLSLHGSALLLLFVSGFGLIAKTNIPVGFLSPAWFWQKILVWGLLAVLTPFLVSKTTAFKKTALLVCIVLALAFYAVWQVITR